MRDASDDDGGEGAYDSSDNRRRISEVDDEGEEEDEEGEDEDDGGGDDDDSLPERRMPSKKSTAAAAAKPAAAKPAAPKPSATKPERVSPCKAAAAVSSSVMEPVRLMLSPFGSAASSSLAKSKPWSQKFDVVRMMSVLMDDHGAFSSKDRNLSREQVDRGDIKPFWTAAAVLFNDGNYKTKFFKDPFGHVTAADFGTEYSGHVTDSASL